MERGGDGAHPPFVGDARDYLPPDGSLDALREAARACKGCPLWRRGTQTVFGEGAGDSRVVLVGDQPGFEEDRTGEPFVGPAGRVLDRALADAGLPRDETYVTNVVKHFKWVAQGKRHLHRTPNAREIGACLPWLEKEIELIRPEVVVALGATAAKALLGPDFRVSIRRGEDIPSRWAAHTVATVHPSSILRQPTSEDRRREMDRLVDDLRVVARLMHSAPSA